MATSRNAKPKLGRHRIRRLMRWSVFAGLLVAVLPFSLFRLFARNDMVTVADAMGRAGPERRVALVLGAGLSPDGKPSTVLQARIESGAALYRAGAVTKIVMSGDNSTSVYDEVSAMKDAAESLGVPREDVLLDYAGFRTLDSCVRIQKVFGQSSIFVVSQKFHLPRAVHLCRWAGVDVVGVIAQDPRSSGRRRTSSIREFPASSQAWLDAHILRKGPKFLGTTIDIDNPPPEALEQPLAG